MGRGQGVRTAASNPERSGAALLPVFTRESALRNESRWIGERFARANHIADALR
jgi:hypothetical protein